ncbi:hypothetical protein HLB23_03960 [Nocardia uniformis]|uniref:CopG family transcriptional regulator n=1 Tax=Nocardia uniformis TaxID=53432 RepID=A0A849BSC9_9NOCA|nr:hypothetical protein [Nocardia uniformis]NNH69034.1 hypothetical protein [Nocardia uniformis]
MPGRVRKTRKVTITVAEEVADRLTQWARDGEIDSVSRYVAEAVEQRMRSDEAIAVWENAIGGRPSVELINRARAARGLAPLDTNAVA